MSGGDKVFDLTSLCTVVAEGQRRRKIVRVGDNQQLGSSSSDWDDNNWDDE